MYTILKGKTRKAILSIQNHAVAQILRGVHIDKSADK
jgi:hypothetical protein